MIDILYMNKVNIIHVSIYSSTCSSISLHVKQNSATKTSET